MPATMKRLNSKLETEPAIQHSHKRPQKYVLLLLLLAFYFDECSAFLLKDSSFRRRNPATTALSMASKTGAKRIKSPEEFNANVLNSEAAKPVCVFFTAPWCHPCSVSIPIVKECIKQYTDKILAFEICTDETPEIAEANGVVSIPTIQIYCKGVLKETIIGAVAKSVLANAIDDMLEDTAKLFGLDTDR